MSRNVALVYAMRQDMGLGNTNDPWSATNITLNRSDAPGTSELQLAPAAGTTATSPTATPRTSTGGFALRTPNGTQSWTFAGDSLTVNAGGSLLYNGYLERRRRQRSARLVLDGGTVKHDQLAADHCSSSPATCSSPQTSTFDAANGDITVSRRHRRAGRS